MARPGFVPAVPDLLENVGGRSFAIAESSLAVRIGWRVKSPA